MNNFSLFLNPILLFPLLGFACLVYYLLPARFRWGLLLVFSLAFYYWISSWAVLVLIGSIVLNYAMSLWISKSTGRKQTGLLLAGILINLALLVAFKYGTRSLSTLLLSSTTTNILYPIGLSFFTVQNISYLVDVSKKLIPAEKNLGILAAYVSFFPKIASGPIERGKNLIPQFRQDHPFDWENITWGARQIVFGLFKKLVIADRLAMIANAVFDHPGDYQGLSVVVGILCFGFQLYFDFSGYSDLALGIARLFGFKLTVNFKLPYLAEDAVEFWNRWHISLSTWLRDYIFYPLRRFMLKHFRGADLAAAVIPPLVTMLASGFWHGTGWTFILWGLYHAVLYIFAILRKKYYDKDKEKGSFVVKYVRITINTSFIMLGWILFRASSLKNALIIFRNLLSPGFTIPLLIQKIDKVDLILSIALLFTAIFCELYLSIKKINFDDCSPQIRWITYFLIIVLFSSFAIYSSDGGKFVYFKF